MLPKHLREFGDADTTRNWIYENALEGVKARFPIEDDEYKLELDDPHYEGKQDYTLKEQKHALIQRRRLHTPIKGTWKLTHKPSGVLVDQRKDTVLQVPYMTQRGTFIRDGNEYSAVSQSRLKPGVYSRITSVGNPEAFYNISPGTGKNFRIEMDEKTGVFYTNIGQAKIPTYPLLKALGVDDKTLMKSWGPDITAINIDKRNTGSITKYYDRLIGKYGKTPVVNDAERIEAIKEALGKYKVNADVVARTLGVESDSITPDMLLRSTQKLLNIGRGEEQPDDRDAPKFSNILSIEDFIKERIEKDAGKLSKSLFFKVKRAQSLGRLPFGALNPYVDGFVQGSRLMMPLEETNPVHTWDQMHRVVKTGEGGIGSADAVTDAARDVNLGQLGFIDPVAGPECYSPDTEVFTPRGWIFWKDIKSTDLFACNIEGRLEFHPPKQLFAKHYYGEMLGTTDKYINYLVTPNHRCFVKSKGDREFNIKYAAYVFNTNVKFASSPDIERFTITDKTMDVVTHTVKAEDHIKMDYNGFVYCAEVPGSLMYVRRKEGIGHWSGNSMSVGIDTRVAYKTFKGRDQQMYGEFKNGRTGKLEYLRPEDMDGKVIAFPSENMSKPTNMVTVSKNGGIVKVPASEVDYQVPSMAHMFAQGIGMTTMPTAMMPGRGFYASKYWSQFMPLVKGEVPLVDTQMGDSDLSAMEYYGRKVGSLSSPVSGVVVKANDDVIHVKGTDGKIHKQELVTDLPFNRMTSITYRPSVEVGKVVKAGDMLAHSNFTDKETGSLNMGVNLKVAIVPASGQSVAGDTPIFYRLPNGECRYNYISESYNPDGFDTITLSDDPLMSKLAKVSNFTQHIPDSGMCEVVTQDGMRLKATKSHSFITLSNDGTKLVPIKPDDMQVKKTVIPIAQPQLPHSLTVTHYTAVSKGLKKLDLTLDYDFGVLLGLYIAEGCVAYRDGNPHRVIIAAVEPDIIEFVQRWAQEHGIAAKVRLCEYANKSSGSVTLGSAALATYFSSFGRYAWGKHMPDLLWTAHRDCLRGFISGYWSGDGCVTKECTASTTSKQLADGLCFALAALGIRATYRNYPGSVMAKHSQYLIHVFRENLEKMPKLILRKKQEKLEALMHIKLKFSRDRIPIPAHCFKQTNKAIGYITVCDNLSRGLLRKVYDKLPIEVKNLVDAPVWWDVVTRVDDIASEEFVYDLSVPGTENFMVGSGWIVHNSYEDAHIISESAAKKLANQRLFGYDLEAKHGIDIDRNKYVSLFPKKFTRDQIAKIGDNGIVKPGTVVNSGDPLILGTGPKLLSSEELQLGKLHRALRNAHTDKSVVWEHDYPGEVIDTDRVGKTGIVNVKAHVPLEVGDKIVTSHALKGVVGRVVKDDEMPRDSATNEPYEMLLNPMGILSRVTPNQLAVIALGKIAKKTGKQIRLPQDPPEEGWAQFTLNQLKENGLREDADIFDPASGKTIKNIGDGFVYTSAFHHIAEKKLSDRGGAGAGSYTASQQPAHGGFAGGHAKRFGSLDISAALSHGAKDVIKDVITIRGGKNEEYWKALKLGRPLPEPQVPFVYNKFLNLLKAGGINLREKGDTLGLLPMTDDDITQLSKGAIETADIVDRNFSPVAGGLFDVGKTGGFKGNRWNHANLPDYVPNPVMEEPVRRLLGLRQSDLENIISGTQTINGRTGGKALKDALATIDIDSEIAKHKGLVQRLRGSNRDNSIKVIGYLQSLKKQGIHPSKLMISKIPIIPTIFRPVARMGDITLQADLNELYRDVIETGRTVKDLTKELGESGAAEERLNLYNSVKAAFGLGSPITPEGRAKNIKGAIRQVIGDRPKTGLMQSQVLSKPVDVVGRGVITPNPNLDMDSIGIPEESAWTLYSPFIMRKLVRRGYPPEKVLELIKSKDTAAKIALREEMEVRPVIVDRAPVWHKFNLMAFNPEISGDKTIRVSPLVTSGFGADFDGDEQINACYINLLDKDLELHYITLLGYSKDWFNQRRVDMSYASRVGLPYVEDGNYYVVNLEDFPFNKEALIGKKDHIDFYEAEKFIKVVAYDEQERKLKLAHVAGWSVHQDREVWLINLSRGHQIVSDDDDRAVYGIKPGELNMSRSRPSDSIGMLVPIAKSLENVTDTVGKPITELSGFGKLNDVIPLNKQVGYVIGALVGDGWYDEIDGRFTRVNLAGIEKEVVNQYKEYLPFIFKEMPHVGYRESLDSYGKSEKWIVSSTDYAGWVAPLIGKGAKNKHLPPCWFTAPREFKLGLVSGLLDTDGTVCITHGKKKPQLSFNYSSISIRLLQEIKHLLLSLGVRSRIGFSKKTDAGNDFWTLSISSVDMYKLKDELCIAHKNNIYAFTSAPAPDADSPASCKMDTVPFNKAIADAVCKIILNKDRTLYTTLQTYKNKGYITRVAANRIIELCPEVDATWQAIVKATDVTWAIVESVENTGIKETGYDLTVPGYETFMSVDGVILSNTMNFHVPVSDKAVKDAYSKMLPSKNLTSLTDLKSVRYAPSKEFAMGLYMLTRDPSKKPVKTFRTKADAKAAYAKGEIAANDLIDILEG